MKRGWIASGLALVLAVGCGSQPAMLRQVRKERLIDTIRQKLLESVEAEKSAVLATSDEESQASATEAKGSAAEINTLRGELRQLITTDKRADEVEKLDAFDVAWADLERVDERLLRLAVANTNLKAARLLSNEGAAALDRFVDGLIQLQQTLTDPEMIRTLARASVAALRFQPVLFAHIPSADDAEMTQLEQRLHDLSAEVDHCLSGVRENAQVGQDRLAPTLSAWADYQRLAAEVVRLSRQNSNVISVDVSLHEKRRATKDCLAALAALSAATGPQATR